MTLIPAITVQSEDLSKPIGFSPQAVNAQVGDAIAWHNNDQITQHQPTPYPGQPAFWGPPIPGQNSSSQVNLNVAGTIHYQDALHPLKGVIVVATPVQIGQQFGGGAAFSPPSTDIVAGTAVSWTNGDNEPHQPAPKNGPANAWLAQPIAPGEKSPPVSQFPKGNVVIEYVDALKPSIQGIINVAPAPVHRWNFAEASGSVLKDVVGNANGTLSGTAKLVLPGPPGQPGAVHIDGSNSSLVSFGTAVGQFGIENFTVALWVNTKETLRFFDIVGNRTAPSHGIFFSLRMTGKHESQPEGIVVAEVDHNGQNYIPVDSTVKKLNDGQWHHVVVIRNGGSLAIYVDDAAAGSGTGSGIANIVNGNPFILGRSLVGVSDRFAPNADYGDLRVYNVALTADQVTLLFNNII